jgi:pyruvate dehydrogenase E2 component (dihydrolipoamide acetyltransferase)
MVEIVRIPTLGLSDFGELVSWEVAIGESVEKGQVVAILESEKASAEIESSASGVLLETYVDEGTEIAIDVGKPLAVVGDEGESAPPLEDIQDEDPADATQETKSATQPAQSAADESSSASTDVKATPRAKRHASKENVDLTAVEGTGPQGAVTTDDIEKFLEEGGSDEPEDVKATPRAKRRAQDEDIDLTAIDGTGPQDAITADDIEQYLDSAAGDSGETVAAGGGQTTVTESRELTGIRKTIADRLSQSAREKPHVMGTREISIEQLERVNERLENKYDVDVSLNDLILFFVGKVLEDLPEFNAHFEDGSHKLIDEVNLGYAVDGPRGLVVPVLREMGSQSLPNLADTRRNMVQRVLNNDHTAEDLQGGTFTITNVGVFDMDVSYSIINPPEVAILAIGRRKYAPVERDGDVEFEKVVTFSLTIDHRVLDGADSGAFLDQLAEYLEYPGSVLDAV